MTTGTESLALAAVSAALSGVVAETARVGGMPLDGPALMSAGMFGVVSMLTALGASMLFKQGMWGVGKTVFNGTVWGLVVAGACVMSEVSGTRTLIYCAVVGSLAELLLSKAYRWARDSDAVTLWQLFRGVVMSVLRIPQPLPPPPAQPPTGPEEEQL